MVRIEKQSLAYFFMNFTVACAHDSARLEVEDRASRRGGSEVDVRGLVGAVDVGDHDVHRRAARIEQADERARVLEESEPVGLRRYDHSGTRVDDRSGVSPHHTPQTKK